MGWATIRSDGTLFQVRVGGVAVVDGRVLLHRSPGEDFWSLPGGRLQVGETAAEAVRREMQEEIGAQVEVGRLLWVIENFFTHTPLDQHDRQAAPMAHHEIGLYLAMVLPAEVAASDRFVGVEAVGTEHEFRMEFRWYDQSELAGMDVRPARLRKRLAQPLSDIVETIVNRD